MTTLQDLMLDGHQARNLRENYDHIVEARGHEQACAALGLDPAAWTLAMQHQDGKTA